MWRHCNVCTIAISTTKLSVLSKGHCSWEGRLLACIFNAQSALQTILLWQIEIYSCSIQYDSWLISPLCRIYAAMNCVIIGSVSGLAQKLYIMLWQKVHCDSDVMTWPPFPTYWNFFKGNPPFTRCIGLSTHPFQNHNTPAQPIILILGLDLDGTIQNFLSH